MQRNRQERESIPPEEEGQDYKEYTGQRRLRRRLQQRRWRDYIWDEVIGKEKRIATKDEENNETAE